ncbi:MAG: hypothetical protein AB1568_04120 [Thermodesulfobacteriota bacterium]
MLKPTDCTLYSGGLRGAESLFGEMAEKWGVKEVNFTCSCCNPERNRNVVVLSDAELQRGDISMELASKMMNRSYYQADKIRKVLQTIFHMVNNGHQVFVVGTILADHTVKGGTGWAVELAKLFNRPLSVFDQPTRKWYGWRNGSWQESNPRIEHTTFVGSGTRNLEPAGRNAIEKLFRDAFGG